MNFPYDPYDTRHHDFDDDRHRPPRRPWSPIEQNDDFGADGGAISRYLERTDYDRHFQEDAPITPNTQSYPNHYQEHNTYQHDYHPPSRRNRGREPSELSVEALDLADYSRTVRQGYPYPRPLEDPYNARSLPFQQHHTPYSYSPQYQNRGLPTALDDHPGLERPFSAQSIQSRDTLQAPPSLVSAGATSYTSHSLSDHAYIPNRRQTMPPMFAAADPAIFAGNTLNQTWRRSRDPELLAFPPWSRGWYESESKKSNARQNNTHFEADLANWPPPPPLEEPPPLSGLSAATVHGDVLPWSSQTGEADPNLTESVKEERIRMLEREFGHSQGKERAPDEGAVGTVGANGFLITPGPRRRLAMRILQGLLSLGAAVSAVYGAVGLHPPKPAPPSGTGPAYVLYILSIVTFIAVLYLFTIYPCLRKRKNDKFTDGSDPTGMMVLPVIQRMGMGGKKGKKGGYSGKGKGKKGKGQNTAEGVQVNLIVDPTMFGRRESSEKDDEDEWADGSHYGSSHGRRREPRGNKSRLSVFAAITKEHEWKRARKLLKWTMVFDFLFAVLWAAEFGFILWGKKCPPGQYDGWCDSYNTAVACGFLTFLAFGCSIFFDFRDLSASKTSPRTRP